MSPFRYRDDDDSKSGIILGAVVGALAGFAAGMFLAQSAGTRDQAEIEGEHADEERHERLRGAHTSVVADELDEDYEDAAEFEESAYADDDYESDDADVTLEERVLDGLPQRPDPLDARRGHRFAAHRRDRAGRRRRHGAGGPARRYDRPRRPGRERRS